MEKISYETSHSKSSMEGSIQWDRIMAESKALDLLKDKLPQGTEKHDFHDMVELSYELEYIPLALELAAAFISQRSITITEYLQRLRCKPDPEETKFLDMVSASPDGKEKPKVDPVMKTWYISFERFMNTHTRAGIVLGEMSFCDCQSIPQVIFNRKLSSACGSHESKNNCQFGKDVQKLIDYCFITVEADKAFRMHGLVQVATRCWLEMNDEAKGRKMLSILRLSEVFPRVNTRQTFLLARELFPHVKAVFTNCPDIFICSTDSYGLLTRAARYSTYDGKSSVGMMFCNSILARKGNLDRNKSCVVYACLLKGWDDIKEQRWSEAEETLLEGKIISEITYGNEAKTTLMAKYYLMRLYTQTSRECKVLELEENLVKGCEKGKAWSLWRVKALEESYRFQEKWQEAERICEQMLDSLESSDMDPGSKEAQVCEIYWSLYSNYAQQKKWILAKKASKRVLDYYVKMNGYDSIITILKMEKYAKACSHLEEHSEAKNRLEHVLKVRRDDFPEQVRSLREMEMWLLISRYHLGEMQPESYKEQMLRQLDLYRTALGEDHEFVLNTWHWVATEIRKVGDLDAAISELRKCWEQKKLKHCDGKSSTVEKSRSLLDSWEEKRDRRKKNRVMNVFGRLKKRIGGCFTAG